MPSGSGSSPVPFRRRASQLLERLALDALSPRGSAQSRCHREMGPESRKLHRTSKGPAAFWLPPPCSSRGAALGAGSLMGDAHRAEEAAAGERERERDWARVVGGGG